MLLKLLKNSQGYLIIFFIFFSSIFFFSYYFTDDYYNLFPNFKLYSLFSLIITYITVTFHSIGLNNLIYEKDVIRKQNFVVAFIFIALNTPFSIHPKMAILSFALLFFLHYLLQLYKQKQPLSIVFNASILLSVLSIFLSEILFLFPLIFISNIVFRNISLRGFILSFIALFIPYFFLWTYQFIMNVPLFSPNFSFSVKHIEILFTELDLHQEIWYYVFIGVIILSGFELFTWMYKKSIKSRESFIIIIFYLIFTVLIFLFSNDYNSIYLVLTPLSIIIANFFVYSKNVLIAELIFILFLFVSIFYRVSMINM